ncbi:hypothetical protein [Azospirillum argentinense]
MTRPARRSFIAAGGYPLRLGHLPRPAQAACGSARCPCPW